MDFQDLNPFNPIDKALSPAPPEKKEPEQDTSKTSDSLKLLGAGQPYGNNSKEDLPSK